MTAGKFPKVISEGLDEGSRDQCWNTFEEWKDETSHGKDVDTG